MKRPLSRRIQPRLESLEDRRTLSAVPGVVNPPDTTSSTAVCVAPAPPAFVISPSVQAAKSAGQQVPFKERLTIVAVSAEGVVSYEGNATHFGHVTAVSYADGSFVKTAANGDSVLRPAFACLGHEWHPHVQRRHGPVCVRHGRTASYVISTDPNTGVSTVDVVGWISYSAGGQKAGATATLAAKKTDTQVLPFKISGGGTVPLGLPVFAGGTAPHNATGTATHLGKYTGEGVFELLSIDFATFTGTFRGTFEFVAANGDRLAFNYGANNPGTFTLNPTATGEVVAVFVAEFTPDAAHSTGRFAKVTGGSFTMTATSEPFVPVPNAQGFTPPFAYTWVGDGTLEFAKGKK